MYPVVPDIAQSRLECIDTGCIHRLLAVGDIKNLEFGAILPITVLSWQLFWKTKTMSVFRRIDSSVLFTFYGAGHRCKKVENYVVIRV